MYTCEYCHRKFVKQTTYEKHTCSKKEKAELIKSLDGQAAYIHYTNWLKSYHRKVPEINTFIDSSFFTAFLNFARFVKKTHIAYPNDFIKIMKEKDISPNLWTKPECFKLYLIYLDDLQPPVEQAIRTVETLFHISDKFNIPITTIVKTALSDNDIIKLIQERKISLWLLLNSDSFIQRLANMDQDSYNYLNSVISMDDWVTIINNRPDIKQEMKEICKDLGI